MNQGPNPPSGGHAGGKGRRRRRGRRGPAVQGGAQQGGGQNSGQQGQRFGKSRPQGRKQGRHGQRQGQGQSGGGIYSAPMDHSYRSAQGNSNGNQKHGRAGPRHGQNFGRPLMPLEPEPLPVSTEATPVRIFAFIDDLFFLAKIQETARKLNVKVEFVKSDKDLYDRMGESGDGPPSLIIFDLNNAGIKPLTMIPKLKSKFKKATNIIGFVSHVQGDLKLKAQEAGCDMVVPRSAFSQNLAQLLRRHGAPDEPDEYVS